MLKPDLLRTIRLSLNLQAKDLFRNLLVLSLDSFQLCLTRAEVQRLCFILWHDLVLGLALRKRLCADSVLAGRDLYELLKQLLIIPLNLPLPHGLLIGTDFLLVPEESLLVINGELPLTRITVSVVLRNLLQLLSVNFVRPTKPLATHGKLTSAGQVHRCFACQRRPPYSPLISGLSRYTAFF